MENPIRKIFSDMSNDELLQGIAEILDSEKSGVIPLDSVIRKYYYYEKSNDIIRRK